MACSLGVQGPLCIDANRLSAPVKWKQKRLKRMSSKDWTIGFAIAAVLAVISSLTGGITGAFAQGTKLDLPGESKVSGIPAPTDQVALSAFKVLDKHCARCHQAGRLDRLKPAKNFGNILKLEEISRDPNLVLPGNPDGSPLFIQMVKQEMPYDVYQEFSGDAETTEDELNAVRTWIEALGEKAVAACKQREFVDNSAIVSAISKDLNRKQTRDLKGLRYVTLTHLYNSCASDHEMKAYRQAVVKLLNSLSRSSDILKLQTIDKAGTIVRFNLDDLNWTKQDWDRILAVYPYAVKPNNIQTEFVESATGTPLAWVRGDWFAYSASRPPLYHDLLKLPVTFAALQKQLGLDVDANIESRRVQRAGFHKSLVSRNNRLIERHALSKGVFWTSYDFAGNRNRQNLFEYPLGPRGESGFDHDGGETIFSLPNGFNAYYLNDADGNRLDNGPTSIVQDQSQRDLMVANGISCIGCHNQGFRKASDEVRAHVLADDSFPEWVRKDVSALYPPVEKMNRLLDKDLSRFRGALREAGIDPDLDLNGVEIINALSQRYERKLDLRLAAAEFGVPVSALGKALGRAKGMAFRVKRRLEQGVVPRDTFEGQFAGLAAQVNKEVPVDLVGLAIDVAAARATEVARVGARTKEQTRDFELTLFSDRSTYTVNDLAVFSVRSAEDCHLTLINVDGIGEGTVIYPNKFQQSNFLKAGREFRFPDDDAPFKFRLKDRGSETVIAVCNATGTSADGIRHDFKTRGFTPLGNYRKFLTRQIVVEARAKVEAGKQAKKVLVAGGGDVTPNPPVSNAPILARTAIKFQVK